MTSSIADRISVSRLLDCPHWVSPSTHFSFASLFLQDNSLAKLIIFVFKKNFYPESLALILFYYTGISKLEKKPLKSSLLVSPKIQHLELVLSSHLCIFSSHTISWPLCLFQFMSNSLTEGFSDQRKREPARGRNTSKCCTSSSWST